MPDVEKAKYNPASFNQDLALPYELRLMDFQAAMQDVYDFFYDVNRNLLGKGLARLDDMIRPAALSGMLSDMITDSMAKHSRSLTSNLFHNGHPDLIVRGRYSGDAVQSGEDGVEVKSTLKKGGAVDTHGSREQTMCVWVYDVDNDRRKAAHLREPLRFHEIYIAYVVESDFRHNSRSTDRGTRTATLDRDGVKKLREGWVYLDYPPSETDHVKPAAEAPARGRKAGSWRAAERPAR